MACLGGSSTPRASRCLVHQVRSPLIRSGWASLPKMRIKSGWIATDEAGSGQVTGQEGGRPVGSGQVRGQCGQATGQGRPRSTAGDGDLR